MGRKPGRRASTKETIEKNTIEAMRNLGTYKREFDPIISVYADIYSQYLRANDEFVNGGYQYETETAAGGTKKSAIAATIENLRKDLLVYSDRLCLNPKTLNFNSPPPGQSGSALDNFLNGKSK